MSSPKTHADKTSAADKMVGFEYQYYYFLYKAISLKIGQSVGLEIFDDVHSQIDVDVNIFYQLKHTTQRTSSGANIGLTLLDSDLWKTLYNWVMVIKDEQAGRKLEADQIEFAKRSEFHLISNKSEADSNDVVKAIRQFQAHHLDAKGVCEQIEKARLATIDSKLKNYMGTILGLQPAVIEVFFLQIRFGLDVDDVIGLVKRSIIELHVEPDRVQTVFEGIDSNLREANFNAIRSGKPVILTFDEFHRTCRKHIQNARSTKLSYKNFLPTLPSDLFGQIFIKRLIEIQAVDPTDSEYAAELTVLKLLLALHLAQWEQSGELTSNDIEMLHVEAGRAWSNEFRLGYVGCLDPEIEKNGRAILGALLRLRFMLDEEMLSIPYSNGELYLLSDRGDIGWHKNWKTT